MVPSAVTLTGLHDLINPIDARKERTGFGLVKERGEAEHVQRGRVFLVGGDDQLCPRVYIIPVGNELGAGRVVLRAPSLSIS